MISSRPFLVACIAFLLAGVAAVPDAVAQPARLGNVVIAIPDVFPAAEGVALLVRQPDAEHRDVIVLRANADAEVLAASLAALARAKAETPYPTASEAIVITQFSVPGASPAMTARLNERLAELRGQSPTRIGDLGAGRWMEFELRPRAP